MSLTFAVITILFPGTGALAQKGSPRWADNIFKTNPGQATAIFPGPPIALTDDERRIIGEAKTIGDIFKPIKVVTLEETSASLLTFVKKAIFHHGIWFVLDQKGDMVFRFSEDGKFLGLLGGKGRGPGEYQNIFQIRVTPTGDIALLDGVFGTIHLYDSEGEVLRDIAMTLDEGRLAPADNFIWHDDSLFLSGFTSARNPFPYGILRFDNDKLKPSFGFGKVIIPHFNAPRGSGFLRRMYEGFDRVGERIWCGSPYDIDIQVFDLQGRWLGELPKPRADGLHREEFKNFDFLAADAKKKYRSLMIKVRNNAIIPLGRFVLVSVIAAKGVYAPIWYLYDANGNLLKAELTHTPNVVQISAFDEILVGAHGPEYIHQIFPTFSDSVKKQYREAGYDPNNPADNPVLILSRF